MSELSFRTRPPASYITPSEGEMAEMAKQVGLGGYNKPLVVDLCNVAAGGSVCLPSSFRAAVEKRAEELLERSDSDGDWKLANGKYTKNRLEALQEKISNLMKYHQNVCDFLRQIEVARFPGNSPLEQAMNLLKLLSKHKGGEGAANNDPKQLPIFAEGSPEAVADKLHETMELVSKLDETEVDMLDPDGQNRKDDVDHDGNSTGSQTLNAQKCAEDLVEGSDKRVMLDISRKLDQFSKLQVRKQKLVKPDPSGEEVRQRPIKGLSELSRVSPTAWASRQAAPANFLYQAVSGQLPVRERVTRQEKKQAIFIIVDGSGSMSGRKHWKATGVVMNRLKAVLSGDAVVWISVFDDNMAEPICADTPESAKELIKKFQQKNFRGGGTNIAAAVKAAHRFMDEKSKSGEMLWRPEVVVLTDEDRSAEGIRAKDIPGTKVHGFAIERKNTPLVRLAESTGGVGIENF